MKLTKQAIAEIRASGESSRVIAPRFGVSPSRITEIRQAEVGAAKKREQKRRWRAENPEVRAADREAYLRWSTSKQARALRREAVRRWRSANPGWVVASNAMHRALRRDAATGDMKAVAAIYAKAKTAVRVRCAYCGKYPKVGQRHVDHVIPLSRGGSHSADNLLIACGSCNLAKHAMTAAEYAALLAERRCA